MSKPMDFSAYKDGNVHQSPVVGMPWKQDNQPKPMYGLILTGIFKNQ